MVLSLLLSSLSTSLNLLHENSLSTLHRANVASPDIIRLLHYIPQPATETGHPQTPHTDLGSLTILFSESAGLQVLKPQSEKWAFVLPKPNCAVVNIGDGGSLSALFGSACIKLAMGELLVSAKLIRIRLTWELWFRAFHIDWRPAALLSSSSGTTSGSSNGGTIQLRIPTAC